MINRPLRDFSLILLALLLAGCTSTKAPLRFPGFEGASAQSLAIVRESGHVFLRAVDGKKYDPPPIVFEMAETFRQYQVPSGEHKLTVYYQYGDISSNDVTIPAMLEAGHTYYFQGNPDKLFVSFGTLTSGKWHPAIFDDTAARTLPAAATTAPAP